MDRNTKKTLDALIARAVRFEDGAATNALLQCFQRGEDVTYLERMLVSPDPRAVKAGVWIASELAKDAAPLLDKISPLLKHDLAYVRLFAIDCFLVNGGNKQARELAEVAFLVRDPHRAVRLKASWFLAHASPEQLVAATHGADSSDTVLLEALLHPTSATVAGLVASTDASSRLFGVAAAVRLRDSNALATLQGLEDPDVAEFAREQLARFG